MGKFDGILICSDIDGTLAHGKDIPQKNIDAINYFIKEGGKFSLCSGRGVDYMLELMKPFPSDAPIIAFNGTQLYDVKKREYVFQKALNLKTRYLPILEWDEYGWQNDCHHGFFYGDSNFHYIKHYEYNLEELNNYGDCLYKITYDFKDPNEAERFTYWARERYPDFQFVRSWITGVEQLDKSVGKGVLAKKLKDYVGANILIGVGDQENDLGLLQASDLAFCPSNATQEVKDISKEVFCDYQEGAIAQLIEALPKYIDCFKDEKR